MNKKTSFYLAFLFATLSVSLLASCGKKTNDEKNGASSNDSSQVVAKVNDNEISVHQVNFLLNQAGQLTKEQSQIATKQVITRLVDQDLLMQKAIDAKLDRDPRVLQFLENTKSQILAQAYMETVLQKVKAPSANEVDAFYNEHPELFEKRRVFKLQELVIQMSKDKFSEVENLVAAKKTIVELADWLKANNYKFNVNNNVKPAEQLPQFVLSKLQPLQNGEGIAIPAGQAINVVYVAESQTQSIPKDKAKTIIEQYLVNQGKNKLAKAEMDDIKAKAKIEYKGNFLSIMNAKDVAVAPVSETVIEKKELENSADKKTEKNIENGVKGIF